jgi:hypothetical protein
MAQTHAEQVLKKPLRELDVKAEGDRNASAARSFHRAHTSPCLRSCKCRHAERARIRVPSFGAMKEALHTAELGKKLQGIKVPKLGLPKMSVPKLSSAQLQAAKERLSQVKFPRMKMPNMLKRRKDKPADVVLHDAKEEKKVKAAPTADVSPLKAVRKSGPSDLDIPRKSSSSLLGGETPTIRRTDAAEPTPPAPSEARREAQAGALKFHLNLDSPVEDAPSIGPKTARRFERSYSDGSSIDRLRPRADGVAIEGVVHRHRRRTLAAEADAACCVSGLRGHANAVGCGVYEAEALARSRRAARRSGISRRPEKTRAPNGLISPRWKTDRQRARPARCSRPSFASEPQPLCRSCRPCPASVSCAAAGFCRDRPVCRRPLWSASHAWIGCRHARRRFSCDVVPSTYY